MSCCDNIALLKRVLELLNQIPFENRDHRIIVIRQLVMQVHDRMGGNYGD